MLNRELSVLNREATLSYLTDNKYRQSIVIAMSLSVIGGNILSVFFKMLGKKLIMNKCHIDS